MTDKELNLLKAQAADILRTGVCFIQEGRQLSEGVLNLSTALAAAQEREAKLRKALEAVHVVMSESEGVAGWHLNGAIATWDEILPEVGAALSQNSN